MFAAFRSRNTLTDLESDPCLLFLTSFRAWEAQLVQQQGAVDSALNDLDIQKKALETERVDLIEQQNHTNGLVSTFNELIKNERDTQEQDRARRVTTELREINVEAAETSNQQTQDANRKTEQTLQEREAAITTKETAVISREEAVKAKEAVVFAKQAETQKLTTTVKEMAEMQIKTHKEWFTDAKNTLSRGRSELRGDLSAMSGMLFNVNAAKAEVMKDAASLDTKQEKLEQLYLHLLSAHLMSTQAVSKHSVAVVEGATGLVDKAANLTTEMSGLLDNANSMKESSTRLVKASEGAVDVLTGATTASTNASNELVAASRQAITALTDGSSHITKLNESISSLNNLSLSGPQTPLTRTPSFSLTRTLSKRGATDVPSGAAGRPSSRVLSP